MYKLSQYSLDCSLGRFWSKGSLILHAVGASLALAAPIPAQFQPAVDCELAGSEPRDMVAARFTRDSHHDLTICSSANEAEVSFIIGDGTGDMSDDNPFEPPVSPWGVAAGDFDGDNVLDLDLNDYDAFVAGFSQIRW